MRAQVGCQALRGSRSQPAKVRRQSGRLGIGYHAIAEACDVRAATLLEIRKGQKTRIRARTERRILGTDRRIRAGGQLIDAAGTWKLIGRLLNEGFTKAELARRLGYKSQGLQLRRERILARSAMRIERFYRLIME